MHKLYVSEGIVLSKRGVGEANTIVSVLTREYGLLRASARSARVEKSKLRYGLETLTQGRFTFVQGALQWRLVGAEHVSNELISHTAARRQDAGRIVKLLLRLIRGEEVLPALYSSVQEGLALLARTEEKTAAESIEALLVLRILAHLGYLPDISELRPFVENDFFSVEMAHEAQRSRALLIRAINESLSATGL
jgi:DNA repair protein RecO (recombination protein O)